MIESRLKEDHMAVNLVQRIKQKNIIKPHDCLVVGLSGGPDSVCLLHALSQLKESMALTIYAAHLNHNLRGMDANQDAGFAMVFSKKLGIHCIVKSEDVEAVARKDKLSIEAAGRQCRYRFLEEVADKIGADKIAVAHHLNDQAETLLLHLLRGSGLTGLVGMVPQRERVIRPLLDTSREEILRYCEQHQLAYCRDATNEEPVVMRNRVRLELLPLMKTYNPEIIKALGRTAFLLERDEETLSGLSQEVLEDSKISGNAGAYDLHSLKELPDALLSRVIRSIWRSQTETNHTLQMEHVDNVMKAVRNRVHEKRFHLPGNVVIKVTTDDLNCFSAENEMKRAPVMPPVVIRENGTTWLPQSRGTVRVVRKKLISFSSVSFTDNPNTQMLSADFLKEDLVLRHRHRGEHWEPLGLGGKKSLKKTFMEMKIPIAERDQQLLLCHGNQVIWVVGKGISEKVRVTEKTQEVLMVEYNAGRALE